MFLPTWFLKEDTNIVQTNIEHTNNLDRRIHGAEQAESAIS